MLRPSSASRNQPSFWVLVQVWTSAMRGAVSSCEFTLGISSTPYRVTPNSAATGSIFSRKPAGLPSVGMTNEPAAKSRSAAWSGSSAARMLMSFRRNRKVASVLSALWLMTYATGDAEPRMPPGALAGAASSVIGALRIAESATRTVLTSRSAPSDQPVSS